MKHLLLFAFIILSTFSTIAQDSSRHSVALNLGGFHQTPTRQSNIFTRDAFHFTKHLGGTYRFKLTQKQSLRGSINYKNMKDDFGTFEYGELANYNEFQIGLGYEFIIKKGKIEPYVGIDLIGVYSQNVDHSWINNIDTYRTTTRLGYGGAGLLGLRYNASSKLAVGIETNVRYLWNKSRSDVVSDNPTPGIGTINYYDFLEFNPFSAIVVKYNI